MKYTEIPVTVLLGYIDQFTFSPQLNNYKTLFSCTLVNYVS